jgi:hypothetical protein
MWCRHLSMRPPWRRQRLPEREGLGVEATAFAFMSKHSGTVAAFYGTKGACGA